MEPAYRDLSGKHEFQPPAKRSPADSILESGYLTGREFVLSFEFSIGEMGDRSIPGVRVGHLVTPAERRAWELA